MGRRRAAAVSKSSRVDQLCDLLIAKPEDLESVQLVRRQRSLGSNPKGGSRRYGGNHHQTSLWDYRS